MKKTICFILSGIIIASAFSGCFSTESNTPSPQKPSEVTTAEATVESTTANPTEAPTEKPTEPPTEPPTEKPAEKPKETPQTKAYTVEEVLDLRNSEILDILGTDFEIEINGKYSHFGSSTGSLCVYNFDALPGIVFCFRDAEEDFYNSGGSEQENLRTVKQRMIDGSYSKLRFVAAVEGAKLNSEISSDMSYNEICEITGIYKTNPPAGQGLITQNLSSFCNNASAVTATYETSNEAMRHMSGNGCDTDFLKDENPDVMYIIAYV